MSILLVSPSGQRDPEVGLLYLLGRDLAIQGCPVAQLLCNGIFTSCDRDAEHNWRRPVSGCFSCMQEQREFAQWSGIHSLRLSESLTPDVIQETIRWVNSLSAGDLQIATYQGIELKPLIQGTFVHRFGVVEPDMNNKFHDRFLRTLILSAVRLFEAIDALTRAKPIELILIPASNNFIAKVIRAAATLRSVRVVALTATVSNRCILLQDERSGRSHECPLIIEDMLSLRGDVATWSPELLQILRDVEEFLEVSAPSQSVQPTAF